MDHLPRRPKGRMRGGQLLQGGRDLVLLPMPGKRQMASWGPNRSQDLGAGPLGKVKPSRTIPQLRSQSIRKTVEGGAGKPPEEKKCCAASAVTEVFLHPRATRGQRLAA